MASIGGLSGSTSSSIAGASSIRGYGGLASGLDRDSLIEGMTYATTAKIQAQKQKQQKLQWTQASIQSISSKLIEFSRKYTSYSSSSNLMSKQFFGQGLITASGANASKVTVTGDGSAAKNVSITSVKQMATNASMSMKTAASTNTLETGALRTDLMGENVVNMLENQTLKFGYGNKSYDVKLTSGTTSDGYTYQYDTAEHAAEAINKRLAATSIGTDSTGTSKTLNDAIEAYVKDGSLQFRVKASDNTGNTATLQGGSAQAWKALGVNSDDVVTLTKDGSSFTNSEDTLIDRQTQMSRLAGKNMKFNYNGSNSTITLLTEDEITAAMAKSENADKSALDVVAEDLQTKLDKAYGRGRVKVSLSGGSDDTERSLQFKTTIPGGGDDNSSVLSITGADYGVMGANGALKVESGVSNRLNLSSTLEQSGLAALDGKDMKTYLEETMTPDKRIDLAKEYLASLSDAERGNLTAEEVQKLESGDLSLVDLSKVSMDLTINGTKIEGLTYASSVSKIMSAINSSEAGVKISYLSNSDKFIMESTSPGASGEVEISGVGAGLLFGTQGTNYETKAGQDAIVTVKYAGSNEEQTIVRGSNSFSQDGMNITINGTFGWKEETDGNQNKVVRDNTSEAITFTAKVDADKVTTAVSDMITAYNEILELVNSEVGTKPNRDYAPLTDQQREAMTETQIEKWETEAKKGMLFNDSDLRTFADKLRFMLSSNYGDKQKLEEMGISVSTSYSDNGKMVFDETKFRAALESDPEGVQSMFARTAGTNGADDKGGLMVRMNSLFTSYATDSGYNKGIFVERAGSPYAATSILNNSIQKQLDTIDDIIERLNDKLKTETDRYISKFTQLETLISQMNSQSSYLSQFAGA